MRLISITCTNKLALVSLLAFGLVSTTLQSQELREVSRAGEKAILAKPGLQMTGARNPDLTIVEYFDYNCPFCKKVVPTFKQLLSEGWRAGAVVPLAEPALQSMLGIAVDAPAPLPGEIETAVTLLGEHRVGELQNHLSKLLVGQGLRRFLEQTLIPLNEAVHERVVRGEMQNFQELRFADLAQRLLRDVTRLVRPTRDARQILLATPPNDPNQLGLAILELLLFTEGINCLTLGSGVPPQEVAGAARAYKVCLAILLFDRGISGKIAGQEIRSLRAALPPELPLVVSGRAVNLLAKSIADVRTAADFSSVMVAMRELGAVGGVAQVPQRA
jgi:hypothetical protein